MKDIVREGNQILRNNSRNVEIPLSIQTKKTLIDMVGYLFNSQDEEKAKALNLRPGVGIAAPQIGLNQNMFAILANDFDGKSWLLTVINPEIIKKSKEITYLPGGEGCLSVDRPTSGITPRHKKITVKFTMYDITKDKLETKKLDLEGYIAIVFQHEYDHLFGTLYVDKIISEKEAKKLGYTPLWETDDMNN